MKKHKLTGGFFRPKSYLHTPVLFSFEIESSSLSFLFGSSFSLSFCFGVHSFSKNHFWTLLHGKRSQSLHSEFDHNWTTATFEIRVQNYFKKSSSTNSYLIILIGWFWCKFLTNQMAEIWIMLGKKAIYNVGPLVNWKWYGLLTANTSMNII